MKSNVMEERIQENFSELVRANGVLDFVYRVKYWDTLLLNCGLIAFFKGLGLGISLQDALY